MSVSCCLSRPIKNEHEKELLVLFEETILIYALALFTCMLWSKFGINSAPAFLAGGVSKRSHCAVDGKNHSKHLEYMHRCMHVNIHILMSTYMQREKKNCNEWKRKKNLVSWRKDRTEEWIEMITFNSVSITYSHFYMAIGSHSKPVRALKKWDFRGSGSVLSLNINVRMLFSLYCSDSETESVN